MLKGLRRRVWAANLDLVKYGLVPLTWGNVSGIDREKGLMVIKPSGVPYAELTPDQMVIVDMDGVVVEGDLKPSSDTPTHLRLYEAFKDIGGVAHTHSVWATSFAQAGRPLEAFGTTHADYFYGKVPVTRALTDKEIQEAYEWATGDVIAETFKAIDPLSVPAALVKQHGPFTWGKSPQEAASNALVLEEAAKMAAFTLLLNPDSAPVGKGLLDKHYKRKHGKEAYYGQGQQKN